MEGVAHEHHITLGEVAADPLVGRTLATTAGARGDEEAVPGGAVLVDVGLSAVTHRIYGVIVPHRERHTPVGLGRTADRGPHVDVDEVGAQNRRPRVRWRCEREHDDDCADESEDGSFQRAS